LRVLNWPDCGEEQEGGGPIRRFLKDLQNERQPVLWTMVDAIMKKVRSSMNLDDLKRQNYVARLGEAKEPIFEFRIPPGKRKEGVARIYFAYKQRSPNTIVLLSAEKKHGKTKADPTKVRQAEERYREVCK